MSLLNLVVPLNRDFLESFYCVPTRMASSLLVMYTLYTALKIEIIIIEEILELLYRLCY